MEEMIFTKILLSFLFLCRAVKADDLLMRKVSAKIELGAKICIEEHGFKKEVADQTKLFWDEDFKPTPEVGCLYECILRVIEITDIHGNLNFKKINYLYRNSGTDADTEKKLRDAMAANCAFKVKGCAAALEFAMCFRRQYLNLRPQPHVRI
ncbi:hypothetical protein MSG28_009012 [Choristoneura fumiferana]|uniref:Uncharacterized protein n=1 Tax=Choristoneura fumiferana TaxID=7141 RepID=A0ACC0J8V8_CHOFU|nr:hypothetical protein MSG28_009012 [Choristoneura fumiferana]